MYTYPAGSRKAPEFNVFLPYRGRKHSDTIIIGKIYHRWTWKLEANTTNSSKLGMKIRHKQLVIHDDTCMEWSNN